MELKKSERTHLFILETVAPIFNQKGFAATSLQDITRATQLTKGSIYGNFINKEDLALQAFDLQAQRVIQALQKDIDKSTTATEKLQQFIHFYKSYNSVLKSMGRCPFISFGLDTRYTFPDLYQRTREGMLKIQQILEELISEGRTQGSIRKAINPKIYAARFMSLIHGALCMEYITGETGYLVDAMSVISDTIMQRFTEREHPIKTTVS